MCTSGDTSDPGRVTPGRVDRGGEGETQRVRETSVSTRHKGSVGPERRLVLGSRGVGWTGSRRTERVGRVPGRSQKTRQGSDRYPPPDSTLGIRDPSDGRAGRRNPLGPSPTETSGSKSREGPDLESSEDPVRQSSSGRREQRVLVRSGPARRCAGRRVTSPTGPLGRGTTYGPSGTSVRWTPAGGHP